MFVPLTGSGTQILGTIATNSNVKGDLLSKIILEAVMLADKAGLLVDYVTCDAAPWNHKMWKIMGIKGTSREISGKRTHPVDGTRSLHFFSDVPHLVKHIGNRLLQTSFNTPDGKVSLDPLQRAFELDSSNLTMKAMPRLTGTHLDESCLRFPVQLRVVERPSAL